MPSGYTEKTLSEGGKKIIITGGAGLIGRPLAEYLASKGHHVYVIDDFSNSDNTLKGPIITYECDVTEKEHIVNIITQIKPDIIYHLACHPYEGLSQFMPYDVTLTTYIATINVLIGAVNAKSVKRFVNYSSMARYGSGHVNEDGTLKGAPFDERYTPNPEDVYACAKVGAERSAQILCNLHGIEWVNCVPHNVYGEANAKALSDPYRGFLLIWTNCLLRDRPFFIHGDGKQKRAPSYIKDCVESMALLGFSEKIVSQTINIGAMKEYELNDIAVLVREEFTKITGRATKDPIYTEARPCEVRHAWCSIQKSVELLHYNDKTQLREGVRNLIQWAYRNFPHGVEPRYLNQFEITEKAPRVWLEKQML